MSLDRPNQYSSCRIAMHILTHLRISFIALLCGLVCAPAQHAVGEGLFQVGKDLQNQKDSAVAWKQLQSSIETLKDKIESACEEIPYEFPEKVAPPKLLTQLSSQGPGIHSYWNQARIVKGFAPPNDSSMHGCAVVLNAHLENSLPPNIVMKRKSRRQETQWDGLIIGSVVIVNGGIEMEGYIRDSIVIASGPIKVDGYIYNSLVISCHDAQEQASIDVESGYINRSIVVGRHTRPGSARQSSIFGLAETDDFRGADVQDWSKVSSLLATLGKPDTPREPLLFLQEKKPVEIKAAPLIEELLSTEQQTRMQVLAQVLEELVLDEKQLQRLIDASESSSSSVRKVLLYEAIRHSRDVKGRSFLKQALMAASPETQIQFLNNLRNPAPFDIPILQSIFVSSEDLSSKRGSPNVCDHLLKFASQNWVEFVTQWNVNAEFGETPRERSQAVYDRRREDSGLARYELLTWLIENAKSPEHRVAAFEALVKPLWPSPTRVGTDAATIKVHAQRLLDSSQDDEFTASIVSKIANWIPPEDFLREKSESIRLAALAEIENRLRKAWKSSRSPFGVYGHSEHRTLSYVAENDRSTRVREKALGIVKEIEARTAPSK